jgi:hypothetical protein
MAYGRWNMKISLQSSNWRELVAIHRALQAFKPVIRENNIKTIQLFSDNATTVYNLNRKAAAITLYKSLIRLVSLTTMGVTIIAAHVPGIFNDHADCLSPLELAGDYRVNKHLLFALLDKWNIHLDVDLFATSTTSLCKSFCVIRNVAGREGYLGNAMNINLSDMTPILHPPISLINKVLEKISKEGELGVLILPNWSGQSWSYMLDKLSVKMKVLGPSEEVLFPGRLMRKRELKLPTGDIALHILRNEKNMMNIKSWNTCIRGRLPMPASVMS